MTKRGILITNLGSPEAPTTEAVRIYLNEFLMDKYVIDIPYLLRALLIKGIVLRTRPQKSAEAYKLIWTKEGSPLITATKNLTHKVQAILGSEYSVKFGMRYGNPSLKSVLDEFKKEGISKVQLLPLYPQWALASTASTLAHIKKIKLEDSIQSVLKAFYYREDFIDLWVSRYKKLLIEKNIQDKKLKTKIVFSFHGIPERHIKKSPESQGCQMSALCCRSRNSPYCYRSHSQKTADAIAKKLGLSEDDYIVTFQSRLGPDQWLRPFTDVVLKELPTQGVERCILFSPAFTADCLETLEELDERGKEDFIHAGGKEFFLVPSLNDADDWAQVLAQWVNENNLFEPFYAPSI